VLLIDFVFYLFRAFRMACYGVNESYAEVNLETTNPERKVEKVNKYEHDSGSELQNSR
jgi:hypothetical protein